MFTSDQPCRAYHWLSARVENLGPSTTTIVPSTTASGAALPATRRNVGQYGSANPTWMAEPSKND